MASKRLLRLETFEDRLVPAQFGVPWQDPAHLSLSLVPDGTPIASHGSELHSSLDGQDPTGGWRETILRAFQSWAVHANLNFAFRNDEGQALGTAGLTQGDPRFGDIRIAAHRMSPEVLAISVPPDTAVASTLSGDVLLNSSYTFDGQPYSLLAVMLHEAGHSLGLGNSLSVDSIMYSLYNTTRTTLSAEDIARVQELYGVRAPDSYEGAAGNGTTGLASSFRLPTLYKGETPLVAFGDITTAADADFYRLSFPDDGNDDHNQGELTIRVQTNGRSLLAPKLTVYDQNGHVLAVRASTSLTGDTLQVKLTGLSTAGTYYVKIEAATADEFGVGSYGLSARFDKSSGTSDQIIGQLLSGAFEGLSADAIDAYFRDSGDTLLNHEEGANDTIGTATPLKASAGYAANTRFEAVASLAKNEDVDFYRLKAPAGDVRVLTVTAWTTSQKDFRPKVSVVDSLGRPVAAEILSQGDGTSTVQVRNTVAGRKYYLRVSLEADAAEDKGNYFVSASFGATPASLRTFGEGTLSQVQPQRSSVVYIAQTQLFRFVLTTGAQDAGARMHLTVRDAAGRAVLQLSARAGEAASGSRLLLPGRHTVTLRVENANGPAISYAIRGAADSDPIGPVPSDATMNAQYTTPPPPVDTLPYYGFPPVEPFPFDPTTLDGYINPNDPTTFPIGFTLPVELGQYPWAIATTDPYYWISLGL